MQNKLPPELRLIVNRELTEKLGLRQVYGDSGLGTGSKERGLSQAAKMTVEVRSPRRANTHLPHLWLATNPVVFIVAIKVTLQNIVSLFEKWKPDDRY